MNLGDMKFGWLTRWILVSLSLMALINCSPASFGNSLSGRAISGAEFAGYLSEVHSTDGLSITSYYLEAIDTPIARPADAVEHGTKCLISEPMEVEHVTSILSKLKLLPNPDFGLDSILELDFARGGTTFLKMRFTDTGSPDGHGHSVTSIMANGEFGTVEEAPVNDLIRFFGDVSSGANAAYHCREE